MIETFYGTDMLVLNPGPQTFFVSLLIGLAFGFALERAGFGSSRKLVGVFYLSDMTVLKVMFTALITGMLGLSFAVGMGWLELDRQVNVLQTMYAAQAVGGLIFGVGFVMGGWCPGTAAVGLASGKLDAVVFLVGIVTGSIVYNEAYPLLGRLRELGAYEQPLIAFGMSKAAFGFLFTLIAVGAFFLAEWTEERTTGVGRYLNSSFLRAFAFALVALSASVFIFPSATGTASDRALSGSSAQALLESIQAEQDHFEPEVLADRLLQGDSELVVVDVRTPEEFSSFHIRGAVNVPLSDLIEQLAPYRNRGTVVLYSNGMTHPAQARDILARSGFQNVFMLTGGLDGFVQWCLKPVSLRSEPLPPADAARVRAWRAFFLEPKPGRPAVSSTSSETVTAGPRLVDTQWLATNLQRPGLKIIDCRSHAEYTSGHIPGSLCVNVENLRGDVAGIPSMILPSEILVRVLSLMGIQPSDQIVIVPGDSLRDATLVSMAIQRVGHGPWAILEGGFPQWFAEHQPLDMALPEIIPSQYPLVSPSDSFTVDGRTIQEWINEGQAVIVDVRLPDYFSGAKSREARPGHIPQSLNRPYSEDLTEDGRLKPTTELAAAYSAIVPSIDTPVVVSCRTGHQASQTFFVLKHILGYKNVYWYDGSWTDWAARPDLPVQQEDLPAA